MIPGVGTLSPETWGKSSGDPWLQALLLNAAPNASILCFDHGMSSDETFSWQKLVESGADVLNTLLKLREDETVRSQIAFRNFNHAPNKTQVQEFPFLFVCHSLGGIVLKQVS